MALDFEPRLLEIELAEPARPITELEILARRLRIATSVSRCAAQHVLDDLLVRE